jgi:hypothetical protein
LPGFNKHDYNIYRVYHYQQITCAVKKVSDPFPESASILNNKGICIVPAGLKIGSLITAEAKDTWVILTKGDDEPRLHG